MFSRASVFVEPGGADTLRVRTERFVAGVVESTVTVFVPALVIIVGSNATEPSGATPRDQLAGVCQRPLVGDAQLFVTAGAVPANSSSSATVEMDFETATSRFM